MKIFFPFSITLILVKFLYISSQETNRHFCYHLINEAKDELDLENNIKKYFKQMKDDSSYCIEYLLKTSNYNALELYVTKLNDEGIKFRETLSNSINSIEKELNEIYNKYKYKKEEYQKVIPAVQWAQNMSFIFLEVKFSHRHDSPGCLEVNNLNINISNNSLLLNAECVLGDIPIKFELDFNCLYDFEKNMSTYSPGSVGRYQLFIKKKENKYWERLLKNENDTPTNLRIWFEMKNKYDDQLKKYEKNQEIDDNDKTFEDIEREIKEKMQKEKKEKKNKKDKKKNKKNKNDKKDKKNKKNEIKDNNKEDL